MRRPDQRSVRGATRDPGASSPAVEASGRRREFEIDINDFSYLQWRRRESNPGIPRSEPSRNVANRREGERSLATIGDDWLRAIAKPPTPRAAFIANLAEHLTALAIAGDVEAARVASEAIGRLLGSNATAASGVDLACARAGRGD